MNMTMVMNRRGGLILSALMIVGPWLMMVLLGGMSAIGGSAVAQVVVLVFLSLVSVAGVVLMRFALKGSAFVDHSEIRWQGPIRRRSLRLSDVDNIRLEDSKVGTASLFFSRKRGAEFGLNIFMLTDYNRQSLPPEELEHLASVIERTGSDDTDELVAMLRSQAEYLRSGDDLATSPLGRFVSHDFSNAGKAGAVGVGVGSLG